MNDRVTKADLVAAKQAYDLAARRVEKVRAALGKLEVLVPALCDERTRAWDAFARVRNAFIEQVLVADPESDK